MTLSCTLYFSKSLQLLVAIVSIMRANQRAAFKILQSDWMACFNQLVLVSQARLSWCMDDASHLFVHLQVEEGCRGV